MDTGSTDHAEARIMASNYNWGVRTTASKDAWVQGGFTQAQAQAEAERLNAQPYGFGPYEAAKVGA